MSDLFEALPSRTSPPMCPKYVYSWTDDKNKEDWRADGYCWRQNGICKPNRQSPTTKIYFHMSICTSVSRYSDVSNAFTLHRCTEADLGFHKGGCPIHLKGAPKAPRLVSTILMIFLRIHLPNCVQFKHDRLSS